jgi:twitching motility protein PilJ
VLVMLLIAVVVYRDNRQATYGTAYIATAGDMRMLSQRLAKASSLALLGDPALSSNCGIRATVSPATSTD